VPVYDSEYPDQPFSLQIEPTEPSYSNVLTWMQAQKDGAAAALCFDFWARGNYTRKLAYQMSRGITPVQVCVWDVGQMRWAYRRLALAGLPVEFVYCGDDCSGGRCVGITQVEKDFLFDAGWGYIGTILKTGGDKTWLAVIGHARLLPAAVLDWLVDEVPEDFLTGRVFVAPAPVIGINPEDVTPSLSAWAGIGGGTALLPDEFTTATAMMNLEIPFLDALSPGAFRTFLRDYEGELTAFRQSFQKLVTARDSSRAPVQDVVKELQLHIAEFTRSDKFAKVRNTIAALGGTIGTFSAAVAIAAKPENPIWWAGLAGAGAAGVSLLNIWKQTVDSQERMSQNPYFILWKLGVTKPAQVKKTSDAKMVKAPKMPLDQFIEVHGADHWLCPPTNGFRIAAVRRNLVGPAF
jgi:hypothetical protein